jgi:hypothetical protein
VRDRRKIMDIESYTRQPLKSEVIEGLEPKQRFPDTRMAGGAGRGGNERSYDRNDRGAPRGRPQGNRGFGGGGFGGGGFGGGGGDRFEGRPAPRFEQRGEQPRFEQRAEQPRFDARKDGRSDVRFEQRPEAGRFENRGDNRFGGAPRQEGGRSEGRFEGRGDSRPEGRFEPRGDSRPARSGPGDKFARAPKPVGAGSFKPHAPGGHGAPKRNPGAKVLKITRS